VDAGAFEMSGRSAPTARGPAVAVTVKRRRTRGSRGRGWSTMAPVGAWWTSANFAVGPFVGACAVVNGPLRGLAVGLGLVLRSRRKHERTVHDRERPFGCSLCKRRFGEVGNRYVEPCGRCVGRPPLCAPWVGPAPGGDGRRRIAAHRRPAFVRARPASPPSLCCEAADARWPTGQCADTCARRGLKLTPLCLPWFSSFSLLCRPLVTLPAAPSPPHSNKHVRGVHKQERPFECLTCGSRFGFRDGLARHARVHLPAVAPAG